MGAFLFNRNLTATLFIGECEWEGDRGKVRFIRFTCVERSSAYNLTHPNDLSTFAKVLVAVVKECEEDSQEPRDIFIGTVSGQDFFDFLLGTLIPKYDAI